MGGSVSRSRAAEEGGGTFGLLSDTESIEVAIDTLVKQVSRQVFSEDC